MDAKNYKLLDILQSHERFHLLAVLATRRLTERPGGTRFSNAGGLKKVADLATRRLKEWPATLGLLQILWIKGGR